jgi:uncharacterized coiled-coil DUF342 family protein
MQDLLSLYRELVAKRDGVNEECKELQAKLDEANLLVLSAQEQALQYAKEINERRLAADWVELHQNIRHLASALGRKDGPLAV